MLVLARQYHAILCLSDVERRAASDENPFVAVVVMLAVSAEHKGDHGIQEETAMPTLINAPSVIQAAGNKPKVIEEFIGRVNSKTERLSVARMTSPSGWVEPGQTPEFDEYTLVLRGTLRVTSRSGVIEVSAGQAVIAHRGEWVQYSTPGPDGAEYVAICLPAFSMESVHRDNS